jgi:acyl-homoserine-lactone acylase
MLRSNLAVAPMVAALTLITTLGGGSSAGPDHQGDHHGDLSATIRYTEYGIPHVVAKDYGGLGFGQGYAAANDNICGIEQAMLTVSA